MYIIITLVSILMLMFTHTIFQAFQSASPDTAPPPDITHSTPSATESNTPIVPASTIANDAQPIAIPTLVSRRIPTPVPESSPIVLVPRPEATPTAGTTVTPSPILGNRATATAVPTPTPTVMPTPTPKVPSSTQKNEGRILWKGDWETGNTSQWEIHAGGDWGDSSVEVVTSPVRQGKYAAKLSVSGGGTRSERAEISTTQANTGGYAGQEWYYSWSTYVPSIPNKSTGWAEWTDITQWMDLLYQCSPPLEIAIRPGNTPHFSIVNILKDHANDCATIGPEQEFDLGPLIYDRWTDFTVHIKWSQNPNIGFIEVWRDGQHVLPKKHLQTLVTSNGVYMEQALYRAHQEGTNVLYHDAMRRHSAYSG